MNYFTIFVGICIVFFLSIIAYGYNSGSCELVKEYECTDQFCVYKEFIPSLGYNMKYGINRLLTNKEIQKRVTISMYPETIFNCATPNKSGTTIATQSILKQYPQLIHYYQEELATEISALTGLTLYPTDLKFPTSCCILIYDTENDWINWHYDHNYYNGRFFTVLIPITTESTCTKFQFKQDNAIHDVDLTDKGLCFEGNYLYHRASKLCKDEKRVILSCQYVTDNSMSYMNQLRIKMKDFAYVGKLL